jgi:4-aminobutyrate aminotransferase/(S)-3-amino-2-methylpropionate transaminase
MASLFQKTKMASALSEPLAPSILTAVPGPSSNAIKRELDVVFDARTTQIVIDYDKSYGN